MKKEKEKKENKSRTRGGWGLNPDFQIDQATEEFFNKGKDVIN